MRDKSDIGLDLLCFFFCSKASSIFSHLDDINLRFCSLRLKPWFLLEYLTFCHYWFILINFHLMICCFWWIHVRSLSVLSYFLKLHTLRGDLVTSCLIIGQVCYTSFTYLFAVLNEGFVDSLCSYLLYSLTLFEVNDLHLIQGILHHAK